MCVCVCVTMCLLSAPVPPLMNSSIHLAPGGGISSRAVSASTALAVRDTRPSQVSHKDAQTNITALTLAMMFHDRTLCLSVCLSDPRSVRSFIFDPVNVRYRHGNSRDLPQFLHDS